MTVLVSDTFTRADGALGNAETGQAWVDPVGQAVWAISNKAAVTTLAGNSMIAVDSGQSDCTVSADHATGTLTGGLCWRATDASNLFAMFPGNGAVYRRQAAAYTQVATLSTIAAGTYSVVLVGNTHTVFLNGAQIATFTDSFNSTATKHGITALVAIAERWDNFTVAKVFAGQPVNTALPAVSGNGALGQVLSTTNGTWTGAPTSFTYQWKRNGSDIIVGATSVTYTTVAADQGNSLTCAVTAINASGSDVAASSNKIEVPLLPVNIAANDANIVFSPYTWDITANRALTINSGAYFRALITGSATAITLLFDVSTLVGNLPQIWHRVDNGAWTKATLASSVALTLPATAWTKHTIEVVVKGITIATNRWTGFASNVCFLGIATTPGTTVTASETIRPVKAVVYGDSIIAGQHNVQAPGFVPEIDGFDAMMGHAWRLSLDLGAEVGCVGLGAQGWTNAGASGVPSFANTWAFIRSGVARDLTTAPPDVIVICHGTNDGVTNPTATAILVINAMLAVVPLTTRICVVRPLGGYHAADLQAAVAAVNKPNQVGYIDSTGWWSTTDAPDGIHPWGYAEVANIAPLLATAVQKFIGDTVAIRGAMVGVDRIGAYMQGV